jgi:hypothetical protein
MTVVSAGVHGVWSLGCVFCPGLFVDGERVHIEAQEKGWAWLCTFEHTDHTRFAHPVCDLNAESFEFPGDNASGADLSKSEFGVHVEVAPQRLRIGE